MQRPILYIPAFVLFPLMLFSSCGIGLKGDDDPVLQDLEFITESLHNSFFEFTILGGTEENEFSLENDGMHGIYGVSRTDADRLEGSNLALFQCIQGVNPSLAQLLRIRTATNNFSDCRNASSEQYVNAVRSIISRLEEQRMQLLEAMQAGTLTSTQVREQLNSLRASARSEVLVEKEKVSEQLKSCLLSYIIDLNAILSPNQWTEFRACIVD